MTNVRRSYAVSRPRARAAVLVACLLALGPSGCEGGGVTPTITHNAMGDGAEAGTPTDAAELAERPVGAGCTHPSDCAHGQSTCLSVVDPGAALHGLWSLIRDLGVNPAGGADEDAGVVLGGDDPVLAVAAPGGYCSAPCKRDEECGQGGGCFSLESAFRALQLLAPDASAGGFIGEEGGFCLQHCDRDDDCRHAESYVCRSPLQNLATINGTAAFPQTQRPFFCLPPAPPL